jgi:hypothetical protein
MIDVVQGDENTPRPAASDQSTSPEVLNYAGPAHLSRMVVVGSYQDLVEAHLACNLLESVGITAILDGENLAATAKNYAPAISNLEVKVGERQADAAREMLVQLAAKRAARFNNIFRTCPACRGEELHRSRSRRNIGLAMTIAAVLASVVLSPAVGIILLLAAGYYFATPEHAMHQCLACGHTWKPSALLSGSEEEEDDEGAEVESDVEEESREQKKATD